jgi:hypothetical protein
MVRYQYLYLTNNQTIYLYNFRSPIQCGCAFYQTEIRARIVGGIESIPHSWKIIFIYNVIIILGHGLLVFN